MDLLRLQGGPVSRQVNERVDVGHQLRGIVGRLVGAAVKPFGVPVFSVNQAAGPAPAEAAVPLRGGAVADEDVVPGLDL
jgi:hypothetical protein